MTTEIVTDRLKLQLQFLRPLNSDNHSPESPSDYAYNCFAWAIGDTTKQWTPEPEPGYLCYWPKNTPRNLRIETIVALYEEERFRRCDDGKPETGYQKIVLYEDEGEILHVARQLISGKWASKLGDRLDIVHEAPETVACEKYGKPRIYMKRVRREADPESPSVALRPVAPYYSELNKRIG